MIDLQNHDPMWIDQGIGKISQPIDGNEIVAKLKNIPMISITLERYLMPWNSET